MMIKRMMMGLMLSLMPALALAQDATIRMKCTAQQMCAVCAATDDSCKGLNGCTTDKRVMETYSFAVSRKGDLTALFGDTRVEVSHVAPIKLYYWEHNGKRWQMRFDARQVRDTKSSEFHLSVITYGGELGGFTNRRRTADVIGFCQIGK